MHAASEYMATGDGTVIMSQVLKCVEEMAPGSGLLTSSFSNVSTGLPSVSRSPIIHLRGMEACPVRSNLSVYSSGSSPFNSL